MHDMPVACWAAGFLSRLQQHECRALHAQGGEGSCGIGGSLHSNELMWHLVELRHVKLRHVLLKPLPAAHSVLRSCVHVLFHHP